MTPYMGLMCEMKVNDMYSVIEFLKEAIREAEEANMVVFQPVCPKSVGFRYAVKS